MKKTIISILTISLLLTSCSSIDKKSDNDKLGLVAVNLENIDDAGIMSSPDRIVYNNIQQLLGAADWGAKIREDFSADLVVIGELIGDTYARFQYQYSEYFGKDVVFFADAFNEIKVIEVLAGNAKTDDVLPVMQHYAVDEERRMFMSYDGMTPMHKGDRWIYFLKFDKHTNAYASVGFSDGRFPLPDKTMVQLIDSGKFNEIETSALGVFDRNAFNFKLYAEILDHFNLQSYDRENPGRGFDAKLLEMSEQQDG